MLIIILYGELRYLSQIAIVAYNITLFLLALEFLLLFLVLFLL